MSAAAERRKEASNSKAVYVTTGAPVPPEYIAVIPIENISIDNEAGSIKIKEGTPSIHVD